MVPQVEVVVDDRSLSGEVGMGGFYKEKMRRPSEGSRLYDAVV